jgi:hypothetical protein
MLAAVLLCAGKLGSGGKKLLVKFMRKELCIVKFSRGQTKLKIQI